MRKSIYLFIITLLLILSSCSTLEYQKSIFNKNNLIAKDEDSYSYVYRSIKNYKNKLHGEFRGFNGCETIWSLDIHEESLLTFDYKDDISQGKFKAVLITPDKEVIVIEDSKTYSLPQGKYRIKIVGNNAKGKLDIEYIITSE